MGITRISPWVDEYAMIEYPIKAEKDLELFEEFMPEPYQLDTSLITKTAKLIGEDGITSPSCHGPFNILAYCYRRHDELFLDPLVNPDFYKRMMEFFLQRIMKYGKQWVDAGADLIDIGANMANGRAVSADFLLEHILPYENRLADFFQEKRIPVLYHNCGYAAEHLHIYDQLHHKLWGYLAPPPHGDVHLDDVLEKVPDDLILWGHVDQIDFLRQASPQQITDRVKYICQKMRPRGNYILGTTDYLETETPPENIRAFVEAGHKYGKYDE
jgi:uroporphyrinogen-III decarboxylase